MLFNSVDFLIFFPIVVLICFVVPKKLRNFWLLLSSYYFYMSWNVKYALIIVFTTVITYLSGLVIEKINNENLIYKKLCVAASLVINLGILGVFKYSGFFFDNLNKVLSTIGIEAISRPFDVLLPVGISFYTFQALGYTIDVYRGDTEVEKNFINYALFVSFFPQLVAGPIERSGNLLKQINNSHKFEADNVRDGIYLMIWGFFLKLVISDRIAVFVDAVFDNLSDYGGCYIIIAAVLFAFQIYCDFAGYSTIAMGAARILGFRLTDNFNAPYLALSVGDFWRRWHMTLTGWFRDYLYIPIGGNRKGRMRKYLNIMIVFLVSGLWHGASWHFVIWGGLNGLYQIIADVLMPMRNKAVALLRLDRESVGHKIWRIVTTFIAVDFAWIFFRANSTKDAFYAVKSIFSNYNPWIFFDDSIFDLGLDYRDFGIIILGIIIIMLSDYLKNKKVVTRDVIMRQSVFSRIAIVAISVSIMVIFGIWGSGYDSAAFIYFEF